jgi:hypothetical protein
MTSGKGELIDFKDICIRHKAQKPVGSSCYATRQRHSQICETFIKWSELWYPCCGYRLLRTKPRNLKYKIKPKAREAIKWLENLKYCLYYIYV